MTKSFPLNSKVKFIDGCHATYIVTMVRCHKNEYVYSLILETNERLNFIAFHEELKQHTDIESGDTVNYLGNYYTVETIINGRMFFKEQIGDVDIKDVTLITRATRSELLNAMHNLYGGTIQNLNSDYYKMGHIKEQYGYLVFKKILSNRIR